MNMSPVPGHRHINQSSEEADSVYHVPVLLKETIEALNIKPAGVYVDCTFGGGGHSREILKKLNSDGRLYVFDQDESAKNNLPVDNRVTFVQQNFRHIQKFLRVNKCLRVDGILADLGVSSHQFDEAARGFSIRYDAALDMRMDVRQKITAADILATYSELELHKLFEKYGEVTNAKTLAKKIVSTRKIRSIRTINEFKAAVEQDVKGNPHKYYAQVFQSLRIEVNDELGALKELLQQSVDLLSSEGVLAVITFHSLEDRIVKNFMKNGSINEVKGDDMYGIRPTKVFNVLTKKPIEASRQEIARNARSRSAKLRVAKKISDQ